MAQTMVLSLPKALGSLYKPQANFLRWASKKSGGSTKNVPHNPRPKHRGLKVYDGQTVTAGKMLVLQRTLRFFPGLHVGFGKNGTLFAIEAGRVVISCEKIDANWNHTWIQRLLPGREDQTIYKKYLNIIPEPQRNCFKLIDQI